MFESVFEYVRYFAMYYDNFFKYENCWLLMTFTVTSRHLCIFLFIHRCFWNSSNESLRPSARNRVGTSSTHLRWIAHVDSEVLSRDFFEGETGSNDFSVVFSSYFWKKKANTKFKYFENFQFIRKIISWLAVVFQSLPLIRMCLFSMNIIASDIWRYMIYSSAGCIPPLHQNFDFEKW